MNKNRQFISALSSLADIDAREVKSVIAAASDIALILSPDGRVRDIYLSADIAAANDVQSWSGASIRDIVTEESRPKIADMVARALSDDVPRWREINHVTGGGEDFPVRYTAVRTGDRGNVILIGRDLRTVAQLQQRLVEAQLTMEQDYERIRQIETRYRVLFETTHEALVIVSADSGRVVDANAAAARILGREARDLAGRPFANRFDEASQTELAETLALVRERGREQSLAVRSRADNLHLDLDVLLFRSVNETLYLCRMSPRVAEGEAAGFAFDRALDSLYERAGDGMVFTDAEGAILHANTAFLAMVDVAVGETLRETSFAEFLGRPSMDLNVMLTNARAKGRLSVYGTTLRSAFGISIPVEISTTYLADAKPEGFGFVIRDVSRAAAMRPAGPAVSSEAVEHIIDLVGSTPLKELVRGTTDVVEKLCIETALKLTNNNRASAADMLGLSRQSLYVKLRKYGLIGSEE